MNIQTMGQYRLFIRHFQRFCITSASHQTDGSSGQPGMACARASGASRRGLRKTGDLRCQERVSSMVGMIEVLGGAGQGLVDQLLTAGQSRITGHMPGT